MFWEWPWDARISTIASPQPHADYLLGFAGPLSFRILWLGCSVSLLWSVSFRGFCFFVSRSFFRCPFFVIHSLQDLLVSQLVCTCLFWEKTEDVHYPAVPVFRPLTYSVVARFNSDPGGQFLFPAWQLKTSISADNPGQRSYRAITGGKWRLYNVKAQIDAFRTKHANRGWPGRHKDWR